MPETTKTSSRPILELLNSTRKLRTMDCKIDIFFSKIHDSLSPYHNFNNKWEMRGLGGKKKIRECMIYTTMGCSPSSSDITIKESVNSRDRGSDFGIGLMTCNYEMYKLKI